MISISDLANELGISKNAINHRLETLGMKHKLTKVGNKYLLNDKQAERIRAIYSADTTPNETPNETKSTTDETAYQALIVAFEALQKELDAKNNQIDELHQIIKAMEITIPEVMLKIKSGEINDAKTLCAILRGLH